MGLVRLFCVSDNKRLVLHENSAEAYSIPYLVAGDVNSIEFTLLTRSASVRPVWSRVNVAGYSLKIGLFKTSNRAQLAYQNAFTDDVANQLKFGSLNLATAAIDAEFAAQSADVACTLEIAAPGASGVADTVYQQAILLKKNFITATMAAVPPGEIAATQAWVQALFVKRQWTAGDHMIAVDDLGGEYVVRPGSDGTWRCDRVS